MDQNWLNARSIRRHRRLPHLPCKGELYGSHVALKACKGCGNQISTKADACPHCGAKNSAFVSVIGVVFAIGFTIWIVSKMVSTDGEEPTAQAAIAANTNMSPVASCVWRGGLEKEGVGIPTLSWADSETVCEAMRSGLGRLPPVSLDLLLSKLVSNLSIQGSKESKRENAYQVMNIVEARGQMNNNKAIEDTLNNVGRIFTGTQGHVTPKDLNVFLRSAGSLARTLDDQGLITAAAMIWEEKKAHGQ